MAQITDAETQKLKYLIQKDMEMLNNFSYRISSLELELECIDERIMYLMKVSEKEKDTKLLEMDKELIELKNSIPNFDENTYKIYKEYFLKETDIKNMEHTIDQYSEEQWYMQDKKTNLTLEIEAIRKRIEDLNCRIEKNKQKLKVVN